VTLTPSSFARAIISTLFLDETACAILERVSFVCAARHIAWVNELCGEGLVVHEEEVDVTGVVDEEGLVAGGHHVAGLLVGTVANLYVSSEFVLVLAAARCRRKKFHL
jgi:hypothetical protein